MGGWSDGRWWEFDLQWRTSEWEETQGIAVCFFEPCLTSNFGWSNLRQLRVLSFPFWNALWLACLQCQKNKDIFYSLLKTLTFTSYSVLPFNEMQTHLGWKLVHFSLSVVIGTKILVLKEYNKKKCYLHIALLLFFSNFLYVGSLWFTSEMYLSPCIKPAMCSFIFILAHAWESKMFDR